MTLSIIETGEVAEPMSRVEAERITARIAGELTALGDKLRRDGDELAELKRQARKSQAPTNGVIYFIQAEQSGHIKIGFAINAEDRLAQLQTGNHDELSLIATKPGTVKDEKFLHRHFRGAHIRGEWFRETPEIRYYIWRYCR